MIYISTHLFLELTFSGKHRRDLVLESKKLTLDRAVDLDEVDSELPRYMAISVSTLLLSFLNYTGLAIVSYVVVVLGIISLEPFIIMSLIAIPKIQPHSGLV
ncbi:hypothetical protein H5410_011183 [Solanum commersonii]|uniref:Uncharacterized protein n=1 Tax=Solanum commersonii TaxID=4109 RepID=A0A9J6AMW1_SOLCO|nr:hypothetical protein H5410_011183 [Solanum commersonii]